MTARPGKRVGTFAAAAVAVATAGVLAGCGSSASSGGAASSSPGGTADALINPLVTSLSTATDSWAIVPMASNPAFWQVFVRSANAASWRLVTPPGVASNGGLVMSPDGPASAGGALTVAVLPSQHLSFTPLAVTSNGGGNWSTGGGPVTAGVAGSPGALAASGGKLLALLGNGTIESSSDTGANWSTIATSGAIAASPAGRACGGVTVKSVSFGGDGTSVVATGTCGTSGTVAAFSYSAGTWKRMSLPVTGSLVRTATGVLLVQAKSGLTAVWDGPDGWYAYAPLSGSAVPAAGWQASAALPVSGSIEASGSLANGGVWVLLPGGRAATVSGAGQQWVLLPPVPADTSVLASGPDGSTDALAVSGSTLTVWRLQPKATVWARVEVIEVPIQYGSSS